MNDAVLAALRDAGVPHDDLALVGALDDEQRRSEGVPSAQEHDRRARAAALAVDVLDLDAAAVASGPLGAGWSADLDVYLPGPADRPALTAAGWLCLDPLLARIGSPARNQWAVVEDRSVLSRADLQVGAAPEPVSRVVDRCERLGRARLREVLEARALVRAGHRLPAGRPGTASLVARDRALGGRLADALDGPLASAPPADLAHRLRAAPVVRAGAHLVGRRRSGVSLSGCDGAGKSTLARALVRDLELLGIPVTVAWTRPGMRADGLAAVARLAKRALGQPSEPGIRAVGRGGGHDLASRRGAIGWAWTALLTASFLRDVWARTAGRRGVVVFDRHALDAAVTLAVVYPGVDTRLQRWVARRLLPRVDVALLVDVDAEVAKARKADDLFELPVLAEQVRRYRAGAGPGTTALDGTAPASDLALQALAHIVGHRP